MEGTEFGMALGFVGFALGLGILFAWPHVERWLDRRKRVAAAQAVAGATYMDETVAQPVSPPGSETPDNSGVHVESDGTLVIDGMRIAFGADGSTVVNGIALNAPVGEGDDGRREVDPRRVAARLLARSDLSDVLRLEVSWVASRLGVEIPEHPVSPWVAAAEEGDLIGLFANEDVGPANAWMVEALFTDRPVEVMDALARLADEGTGPVARPPLPLPATARALAEVDSGRAVREALENGWSEALVAAAIEGTADPMRRESWQLVLPMLEAGGTALSVHALLDAPDLEAIWRDTWAQNDPPAEAVCRVGRAMDPDPERGEFLWARAELLRGAIQAGRSDGAELATLVEAFVPTVYDPNQALDSLVACAIEAGDPAALDAILERGGPHMWQITYACWAPLCRLAQRGADTDLLIALVEVAMKPRTPGFVAARDASAGGLVAGTARYRPEWLRFDRPVELLALAPWMADGPRYSVI